MGIIRLTEVAQAGGHGLESFHPTNDANERGFFASRLSSIGSIVALGQIGCCRRWLK
jgi:hypothetical protein